MITGFYTTVKGVFVFVEITYWEKYVPGNSYGDPNDCYPDEGGYGDFALWDCTSKQHRMKELENDMTEEDKNKLQEEMFKYMEDGEYL